MSAVCKTIVGVLMLLPLSAYAGSGSYHICTDEKGRKLFSQTPCPKGQDAAVKEYTIKQPDTGAVAAPRLSHEELRNSNRKHELQRLIKRNKAKLDKLTKSSVADLNDMKQQLEGIGGNNRGTRKAMLFDEILQKREKYKAEMADLRKTIDAQEQELASLQ